ncbi:hypothetical protein HYPSUDRAFT_1027188 [Hypholoma sublateritium FD-334 SS-4]|uniref:Uncharacterized protein n=1 Tax=Hypholoma sublateritium (strain FD-334 SS-4) TaxID=945553 RepID=A0A0D2PAE5_HYPSF|nr:hypothetical protein HYPSUDRAFT_1027188 [Hypholoma sublateritium FD-334 SS-4]
MHPSVHDGAHVRWLLLRPVSFCTGAARSISFQAAAERIFGLSHRLLPPGRILDIAPTERSVPHLPLRPVHPSITLLLALDHALGPCAARADGPTSYQRGARRGSTPLIPELYRPSARCVSRRQRAHHAAFLVHIPYPTSRFAWTVHPANPRTCACAARSRLSIARACSRSTACTPCAHCVHAGRAIAGRLRVGL